MRTHVILAVLKRNVASYFSGVLGYLFIFVFVVVAALATFSDEFFANNLATLDQLNEHFPLLLLFIVPAITMTSWSDERKLGTDELLFTLPASDLEILIGKYLACLAVYTVALLFSTCQLAVLSYLADPDWGMIIATYLGYWLAGAAMLSIGMFASALTSSATVAFVLGVLACSIPVFISWAAGDSELLRSLSISERFAEFAMGAIPLNGVLYFISLTVFALYLNLVMITKRHWSASEQANMGTQFLVRTAAVCVILVSLNVITRATGGVFALQADLTAEKVFSLTDTTHEIVEGIPEDKPVEVIAFISEEVPPEYVTEHKRLTSLLRQYDRIGGSKLRVRFVEVVPFSDEVDEAAMYGIQPRTVQSETGGRLEVNEHVYLGVVISSPTDEVVVPFFDHGVPIEYELTRSIRTVSKQERLTVGILETDARVNGGFDPTNPSGGARPEWELVKELKKQYEVKSVSAGAEIDADEIDVLIAVLPSSLTDPQMQNLLTYVEGGNPILIFDDPMPAMIGPYNAPKRPRPPMGGGMMGMGPQASPPKADGGKLTRLMKAMGISWDYDKVVWDEFNPHTNIESLVTNGLVWITPESKAPSAFNSKSEISSGLQEFLAFYPGQVRDDGSESEFIPLMATRKESGVLDWEDFTQDMGMYVMLRDSRQFQKADDNQHALAAYLKPKDKGDINAVFIADIDCITDTLFNIVRNEGIEPGGEKIELHLDNITLVMNAVDMLAGDDSYFNLRKHRQQYRTLLRVQDEAKKFRDQAQAEIEKAEKEATAEFEEAQERFDKQREAIESKAALSTFDRLTSISQASADEDRKMEVLEENIKRRKQRKIREIEHDGKRNIRELENSFRNAAVTGSGLPALLLGLLVLMYRVANENRDTDPRRRV